MNGFEKNIDLEINLKNIYILLAGQNFSGISVQPTGQNLMCRNCFFSY